MTRRAVATTLITLTTGAVALPAIAMTVLGLVPRLQVRHVRLALASSFVHLGGPLWALVLVGGVALWLLTRARTAATTALVAVAALAVHAAWIAPYYRADTRPSRPVLGLTSLNVQDGNTDGESLARRLAGSDVVVLLEATPETVAALSRAGMDQRYPHRAGRGAPGVAGTVIYSRLPMTDLGTGPTIFESRLVRVEAPTGPVLVAGVHPVNPLNGTGPWVVDAAQLHSWLRPHLGQDIVVAGDFNSVDRHVTMRPYWDAGLRDAAQLAGSGLPLTWPAGGQPAPFPVIGIDHVLVAPRLTVTRHELLQVPDTDHLGVRVTVGTTA